MPHRITLIPGDGVCPEITEGTAHVLQATGVRFNWDVEQVGIGVAGEYGSVARISGLDEQGRMGRSPEDFGLSLKTMSGLPNRHCAETRSTGRQ